MEDEQISESPAEFLATVGDVKEITATAIAEVIDNQNELATGAILNDYREDVEENTKWLELKTQIQAQSEQLATMTAILTTTQATILTAVQSMTELMTAQKPDPKPETETEKETKPETETRSKESTKSAASELANMADNPATTVLEAAQSAERPAAKVRKRF